MANGLLLRLRERELSASPAERNVIAYVSAHPHEVVGLSVRGLADATFSSPSSILRFCKRLGFAGYKEFQRELIAELAPHVARYYAALSGDREQIKLKYRSELNQLPFDEILRDAQPQDRANQYTTRGVHRDDLRMTLGDYTLRKYGSQGQQRTAAMSLKLSEIHLVERKIKDVPILLLDDVLSELDVNRQNYLLESIKNIQTMITCTGLDEFVNSRFEINKLFKVVDGTIVN